MGNADFGRLSSAIRRLSVAASASYGADCWNHASISRGILSRLGIEAQIVVGYAAWRVGEGDGDVVLHAPVPNMPPQQNGAPYHAWLELGDSILDFTTYQLRDKAKQLDALDGGTTCVDWCPDFIFTPNESVSTLSDVTNLNTGLFYYERNAEMEEIITGINHEADAEDVDTAWMLYNNQNLCVVGPNCLQGLI